MADVQQKYAAEAQKRLRPDGLDQFQVLEQSQSDRLRHLVDDIWADHAALDATPPAIKQGERTKILIAGAGMGGILAAVRLIQAGFSADQIRLIEHAGGVGGTWYWNRYPGLHCDVESYIYMPLLEETGFKPSHKYASGIEIRTHLEQVVEKYHLADKILFRTLLNRLEWNEEAGVWKADITTARGPDGKESQSSTVEAEFTILTAGLLARPQVPKLAGFEDFKGQMLHTARWDYNATGGSNKEVFPTLEKLKGKRVGMIGTGATAIQVLPCLADNADEVFVFQRTPSAVYTRGQRPTEPADWAEIAGKPGWQDDRMRNFVAHITKSAAPDEKNLINDAWSNQEAYSAVVGDPKFAQVAPEKVPEVIGHFLAADAKGQALLRARIAEIVEDKATAEKLTPWYPVWCKRPTFSDTYLQAFNKPHVHLVDTDGKGVDRVTETGLVVQGTEYRIDILVLATGYLSPAVNGTDPSFRAGVKIAGRGGRDFSEKWLVQGTTTLHGCATNGFPNLFFLGPSQAGVAANQMHALEVHCRHIAHIVAAAHEKAGGLSKSGIALEVESAAEEAWSMRILAGAGRFAVTTICTPGYLNNEGQLPTGQEPPEVLMKAAKMSPWSGGLLTFVEELEKWRGEGSLSGYKLTTA